MSIFALLQSDEDRFTAELVLNRVQHETMEHVPSPSLPFVICQVIRAGMIDLTRAKTSEPRQMAEIINEFHRQAAVHAAAGDVDDDD